MIKFNELREGQYFILDNELYIIETIENIFVREK